MGFGLWYFGIYHGDLQIPSTLGNVQIHIVGTSFTFFTTTEEPRSPRLYLESQGDLVSRFGG